MLLSQSHFFIIFFLLTLTKTLAHQHSLKLPLLHTNPFPFPSAALSADLRRLHRKTHRQPNLPVTSAAAFGSGQYLVSLHVGTPPQRLLLAADTGSDLTWATCSACRRPPCAPRAAAAFFPRHSSTFHPYHCYDHACRLVPAARCGRNRTRRHTPCRYTYSYSDDSVTAGFFSTETTTFNTSSNKLVEFKKFSFGCGFWNTGPSLTGPSFKGGEGVLGLGRGPISFTSQLGREFGHKFSYCLMDYTLSPPPTSYLLIGGSGSRADKLSYTPLLVNPLSPTFYYVGIEGVEIDKVKLRISPSVWRIDEFGNGGTVVDSGTTLSFLPEPAYRKILAVFERLVKLPRSAQPASGFDLCLNVSGLLKITSLPRLSFRLGGGSVFEPPPENYFIDTAEGVKCLALQPVTSVNGFSIIGNLMQQGYTFEFDKDRSRLGFTRHGCSVA